LLNDYLEDGAKFTAD